MVGLISMMLKPKATIKPQVLDDITPEYMEIAQSINMPVPSDGFAKVQMVLAELKLKMYDNSKVDRYMKSITPMGKKWCWTPLRRKDLDWAGSNAVRIQMDTPPLLTHGRVIERVYSASRVVPLQAIKIVKKVQEADSDTGFMVTDYAVHDPDPFLGIFDNRGNHIVVFHWDEPGFKP